MRSDTYMCGVIGSFVKRDLVDDDIYCKHIL